MEPYRFDVWAGNVVTDRGTVHAESWTDAMRQVHGMVYQLECHSAGKRTTRIVVEGPPAKRMAD